MASIWRGGPIRQFSAPHRLASQGRSAGWAAARRSRSCTAICNASVTVSASDATSSAARTLGRIQMALRRASRTNETSCSLASSSDCCSESSSESDCAGNKGTMSLSGLRNSNGRSSGCSTRACASSSICRESGASIATPSSISVFREESKASDSGAASFASTSACLGTGGAMATLGADVRRRLRLHRLADARWRRTLPRIGRSAPSLQRS